MSTECADWAAKQSTGNPDAKLLLVLMAMDVDKGVPGAASFRLAYRAEMPEPVVNEALTELLHKELVEVVDDEQGFPVYAPKGWLE